jgi:signal transduction histidine kinase
MATILIADDDPAGRKYLKILLGYHGHRLLEAADGDEALTLTRERHPDLAIVDLVMPRVDGYEFVRRLRSDPSIAHIPVIFYSAAYLQEEARTLAGVSGVDHFLPKPVEPETILEAVAAALGSAVPAVQPLSLEEFGRVHQQLLTDKLAQKVQELEREIEERLRAEEQLRALSRRLIEVQEAERRHIAHELHDEFGQTLTALKILLHSAQVAVKEDAAAAKLEECAAIANEALQQVRSLSVELRPAILDDLGLSVALRWYLDRQAQRTGLNIRFDCKGCKERYSALIEITGFRVVQEALTNILRYAQAEHAWVMLRGSAAEIELSIRDDGAGFDVEAARKLAGQGSSLGLLGMEERVRSAGGVLEIVSTSKRGTEVRARLPRILQAGSNGKV